MTFTIPGEPVGKARPRVVRNGGRVHTYTPQKTADYERRVRSEYLAAGGKHYGKQAVSVHIIAEFGIPKSASKAKRQKMIDMEILPTKPCDVDNLGKLILDSIQGVAYDNDSCVVQLSVMKIYSCDPKVIVEVLAYGGETT